MPWASGSGAVAISLSQAALSRLSVSGSSFRRKVAKPDICTNHSIILPRALLVVAYPDVTVVSGLLWVA